MKFQFGKVEFEVVVIIEVGIFGRQIYESEDQEKI